MTEKTPAATGLYRSIHTQPEALRELLADWELPTQIAERLHGTGRIFLAGIGTSYHAAIVGEYLLRLAGVDAWAVRSYEFVKYPRPLRADDSVMVISHRGGKLHGTMAVQRALHEGVLTVGITGKNSKMQGADISLETVEQDISSTHSISYTGALTRLGQIAARLATLRGAVEQAQRLEQGLSALPAQMDTILQREDEIRQVARDIVDHERRVYFVGAGPNSATAPEGALKAKEAAYITAEGFELEQAIHGPMVAFEPNDLIVSVSVKGPAQPRMADFLLALSQIGTRVLLLGDTPSVETMALFNRDGWTRFALADGANEMEELTPFLAALPVQLLADFLAAARGTNADSFRLDQDVYKRANARLQL